MSFCKILCKQEKCDREKRNLLNNIENKFKRSVKKFLLSSDKQNYNEFSESIKNNYSKNDIVHYTNKYKKFILENLENHIDLKRISDDVLLKIEKKNELEKYTLLDKRLYIISGAYKLYGMKLYDIYLKLLRNVYRNQNFETKITFTENQKILVKCCEQSYNFSKENKKYRPLSFTDPKFKTVYDYQEDVSDINRSVWRNQEKNIFRNKVVIIAYRGTGVEVSKNKFLYSGNFKRDFVLDLKIGQGKLTNSPQMKKIISDFDKIYKIYGKDYDFYLTGHSLGGRIAFEIHRARPRKIKECHVFNAGFGLDINYLKDIMKSKKRDYEWEKNLYSYHIGGKKIYPTDDDFISVLAGGYGKSSTFYKNFNTGLKGHAITNFKK